MFTEKSPLTSSGQPAYSFQNPSRAYKKQAKQLQCLMCTAVLGLFTVAIIIAIMISIDDGDMDILPGGNSSLQSPLLAKTPGAGPKPIKLYTSGMVISGSASGALEGEETKQIFDGSLPVTIPLDNIIDPNAYSATAALTWSGVVVGNNTLKGTFSLPVHMQNSTGDNEIVKMFKGNFEFVLAFKWSANLDIVIPNKVYNCKAIFLAAYKSSLPADTDVDPRDVLKGKTETDAETCTILFQGSFYEKSFFCYITPWWCTDDKLFYWNGGVEFKIVKPVSPPPTMKPPNSLNMISYGSNLKAPMAPVDEEPMVVGSKILGRVSNGWLAIENESGVSTNVWSGQLPFQIPANMLFNSDYKTGVKSQNFHDGPIWSCKVFSNSLQGKFRMQQMDGNGMSKWVNGTFFFLLDAEPLSQLSGALESGVTYTSTLHLRDSAETFNGTQVVNFYAHNNSYFTDEMTYKAPLILLGELNKATHAFTWNGVFEMITKKTSQGKIDNQMNGGASALKLGSPWTADSVFVGSKLIGKVKSGWITKIDEMGTKTIWEGAVPMNISVPLFFNPTTDMSDLSDEFGHGAIWSCSVFHSSLRGSYQLPQYTKFGLVKWVKGSFFFQLESNPSWSLFDIIYAGVNYNSPIHLRNSNGAYNGSKLVKFYSHETVAGQGDLGFIAPLYLQGKFDKPSNSFSWDGTFELVVKLSHTKEPSSNTLQESSSKQPTSLAPRPQPILNSKAIQMAYGEGESSVVGTKILGKVLSGWITITDEAGTRTIWNGKFPAEISAPMFYNPTTDMSDLSDEYGHGAVWSCSVFHSSMSGSFQLPQYTKFGLVKWLKGSFFFQLESNPYWSIYSSIVPGINYYSPIHFRNSGSEFTDVKAINVYSNQKSPLDDLGYKTPIFLLGKGKGGKSFTWDGRFVAVVKNFF